LLIQLVTLLLTILICLIGLAESFVPTYNIRSGSIVGSNTGFLLPTIPPSVHNRKHIILRTNGKDKVDKDAVDIEDTSTNTSKATMTEKASTSTPETSSAEGATEKKEKVWNTSLFPAKTFYPPPEVSLEEETSDAKGKKRTRLSVGAKKLIQRLSSKKKTRKISPSDVYDERKFRLQIRIQGLAATVGLMSGVAVSAFKMGIEIVKEVCYTEGIPGLTSGPLVSFLPVFAVTTLGGIAVAVLASLGAFPPGVRGEIDEVDDASLAFFDELHYKGLDGSSDTGNDDTWQKKMDRFDPLYALGFVRKAFASIFTLGTGCSLGPEGPSVEVAMAMSRICMFLWPPETTHDSGLIEDEATSYKYSKEDVQARIRRNRLLLSCGAAAGVSAGFNAPLAGVFFALEVVQAALPSYSIPEYDDDSSKLIELEQESLSAEPSSITAILIASVVSGLVARVLLGNELALVLTSYEIKTPLLELPLYLLQGALSGLVAVAFSQSAKLAKRTFDGDAGPRPIRKAFGSLPGFARPMLGALTCGIVGIFRPEVLFFGYETLNGLLSNNTIPTLTLLLLLAAKIFTTAVSAGSGLVGGTFAPSLFLGGMCGASFHNIVQSIFNAFDASGGIGGSQIFFPMGIVFQLADVPAYAMVGAASTLAALFRAPLTASLLLFELTRNYDILIPLLASAGVGSLVSDIVESKIEARNYSKQ